ncbi:STAS domain-containing protein [Desulfobacterales bacterium HSG16]|nr:STAS domain-containing protein [Desulfobacterales bacterium HSG16]
MEIEILRDTDRTVMKIRGKIDEKGSEQMKNRFHEEHLYTAPELVFDFADVDYVGSACIGKLLLFYKKMFDSGGQIRIINASSVVYELLIIVKLDDLFTINK